MPDKGTFVDEDERTKKITLRNHYRNVFAGSSGDIVFLDLIERCHFFEDEITPDDWEKIARRNFIMELIEILGCGDDPKLTAKAIKDSIIKLPMTVKKDA